MWIAKIILKHDCIIGNRCKEFGVILQSYDLNNEYKSGRILTSSIHQMIGDKNSMKRFVLDLKNDKRVKYIEVNYNTIFLVESSKHKPVSFFNKRMFFVKPVIIDSNGFEHWEIASHNKEELMVFIKKTEPLCEKFTLASIKDEKLNDVYFPKVLPKLTNLQKKSFELAVKNNYYHSPKGIGLRQLAKIMNISLSTYQKHLQVAESKVMPDILSYLK